MENEKIKKYVKKFIDSHEPDTFVRDNQNRLMYTAGHSTLNLESFFEDLLEDFISEQPKTITDLPSQDDIKNLIKDIDTVCLTFNYTSYGLPPSKKPELIKIIKDWVAKIYKINN